MMACPPRLWGQKSWSTLKGPMRRRTRQSQQRSGGPGGPAKCESGRGGYKVGTRLGDLELSCGRLGIYARERSVTSDRAKAKSVLPVPGNLRVLVHLLSVQGARSARQSYSHRIERCSLGG